MGGIFQPELIVMESSGIYWKSPYAALQWYDLTLAGQRLLRRLYKVAFFCGTVSVDIKNEVKNDWILT
jgi:hypothetical protein